jgi:uncharacterized protein YgiM (DUF1202 family)
MTLLKTLAIAAALIAPVASAHAFETDNTCAVVLKTSDDFLALRWGAGKKYKVIEKLKRGEVLEVVDAATATEHDTWLRVVHWVGEREGNAGWVYNKHVQIMNCSRVRPE